MEIPKHIIDPIIKAKSSYLELIGEELTCISTKYLGTPHGNHFKHITKGKKYKVIDIDVNTNGKICIRIQPDNYGAYDYDSKSSFPIENFNATTFLRDSKINTILK